MRLYRDSAATGTRVAYGIELIEGLKQFGETAGFAEEIGTINNKLDESDRLLRDKDLPLRIARQKMRFANFSIDEHIRVLSRRVEIAEGGRRGPLFEAVFPRGTSEAVSPVGRAQIEAGERLLDRMKKSQVAGMDELRAAELAGLEGAVAAMRAAVEGYERARSEYLDTQRTMMAIRDEHRIAVDRVKGLVRAAFPGDRARQDVIFPEVSARSTRRSELADDDDDPSVDA